MVTSLPLGTSSGRDKGDAFPSAQSVTLPSFAPDTMNWPLGLKATALVASAKPTSKGPSNRPVDA
jgi:hypothetical protein